MKSETLNIRITFTEPLLGTASGNRDVHEEFIASRAPNAKAAKEETQDIPLDEQIEKSSTIFHRDDTGLHLFDYQVKGFFKEAIGMLVELGDADPLTKWTYKRAVDGMLFIRPRKIYLEDLVGQPWKEAPERLQRPLRAETMKGERVALANSEMLVAGTSIEFKATILTSEGGSKSKLRLSDKLIRAALDYGALCGMGQWRNGGYGRFEWTTITI